MVARNCGGRVLQGLAQGLPKYASSFAIEAQVVLQCIQLAQQGNMRSVTIETDNQQVLLLSQLVSS